jgi:tRNA (uracil-5-)-methyltransferase
VGPGEGVRSEVGEGEGDSGEGVSGEGDKYQYLQRGFTSEIFKIEIQNIPKYIGYGELKKKLEKLGLKPVKIKKPQRFQHQPHCFVTFRCEEDREFALEALKGVVWKNKTITAKVAAPSVDPLYRQRNKRKTAAAADGGEEGAAKRARLDQKQSQLSLGQRLDKVVTPLLGTAYESQLATKTAQMRLALQKAAYLIQKEGSNPGGEFARQVDRHRGMMCELEPILASVRHPPSCLSRVSQPPDSLFFFHHPSLPDFFHLLLTLSSSPLSPSPPPLSLYRLGTGTR